MSRAGRPELTLLDRFAEVAGDDKLVYVLEGRAVAERMLVASPQVEGSAP